MHPELWEPSDTHVRSLLLLPVLVQAVKRDRGTPTPDHARAWLGLHADQEQQMQYGHHDVQRRNLHDWLLGGNYEGLLLSLVDANPALVEYLRRWTISCVISRLTSLSQRVTLVCARLCPPRTTRLSSFGFGRRRGRAPTARARAGARFVIC